MFQSFCHSYFLWENLVPQKQTFAKLNEIWSRGTLYIFILNLTFIFSKILFIHVFFWQILPQNVTFFKLTEIWYIGRFYCLFLQFFCHSYSFGQICSQNMKFFKMNEMSYFDVYFFKILIIHIFGLIWSHKLKFSILTEIWCSIASLYA